MIYQQLINSASYEKELRDMNAEQLETEYYRIITNGDISKASYHLNIIRKSYRQITGEDIQTVISKTA